MTSVVNVRVVQLREGGVYNNVEEWLADEKQNVYIGRRMRIFIRNPDGANRIVFLPESPFANTFKVDEHGRAEALELYRRDMRERLKRDAELCARLRTLHGKTLGCWCKPDGCHGDVLLELIEEFR